MASQFRFLAQLLGPDQPFYGIQVPTAERKAELAVSIETISAHHVEELVRFQPTGPFILGGHSTGAMIALEMAQQLRAQGRVVSLLVVFDGELFNTGAEIDAYNPLYWFKVIWGAPRWLRYNFSRSTPRGLFKAAATKLNHVRNKILGAPRDFGREAAELFNFKTMTADHGTFIKTLYESQYSYIPKTFSGRVVVFTSNLNGLMSPSQVRLEWRKIAPSSAFVSFNVPHGMIVRSPDVAARLTEYISLAAQTLHDG
jgi:pimeloyl-ACP methyl ester carboxylesterase